MTTESLGHPGGHNGPPDDDLDGGDLGRDCRRCGRPAPTDGDGYCSQACADEDERGAQEGEAAAAPLSRHALAQFPVRCRNCGRVYETPADFAARTDPLASGEEYQLGAGGRREIWVRNCRGPLGGTMAVELDDWDAVDGQ